jgi:hypothetical protein
MDRPGEKSTPVLVAISWLIVLIPLGWGVVQSVVRSLPLFGMAAAPEEPRPLGETRTP